MFANRIIAMLAAGAALIPAALPAATVTTVADDGVKLTRQVRVEYADLNLASEPGQRALNRRVRYAMTQVCGVSDPRDPGHDLQVTRCKRAALADAKSQIDRAVADAAPRYANSHPATTSTASGS